MAMSSRGRILSSQSTLSTKSIGKDNDIESPRKKTRKDCDRENKPKQKQVNPKRGHNRGEREEKRKCQERSSELVLQMKWTVVKN